MKREGNLFIPNKTSYVRRKKEPGECILCSIANRDEKFPCLEIFRTELFFITANLFPYNPGHIMLVPMRHYVDLREMDEKETLEQKKLLDVSLQILDEEYHPSGYNIGWNFGDCSGASIPHIHMHIVPRFKNELGFVDIVSGSRIIIDDPDQMMKRLRDKFKDVKI